MMNDLFQLVLVDDRKNIVQGIASAIDWAAKGVQVTCFYNGRDALQHILETHPDMVITDIQMPYMSGLEMVGEIMKVYSDIRCVILTGYDEFSYAREALRLGVVEYLSKPVRIQDVEAIVEKGMELSRETYREKQERAVMKHQFLRNLPVLRSQWFLKLLKRTDPIGAEELESRFAELEIRLKPEHFLVLLVEVERSRNGGTEGAETGNDLLRYAASNIGKELLEQKYACETFQISAVQTAFLINYQAEVSPIISQYELYEHARRLQELMQSYYQVSVSIGIGGQYPDAADIIRSFREASMALEQRFYVGEHTILSAFDVATWTKADTAAYPADIQERLLAEAGRGKQQEALDMLQEYFQGLRRMRGTSPQSLRERIVELLLKICRACEREEELRMKEILNAQEQCRTLDALEEWMTGMLTYLMNQTESQSSSEVSNQIARVKAYIDAHYAENISLKKMSEYVFLSQSYLSFSFKKTTGVNFNDYITGVRMEKAKELLAATDYKVYEVCELVGYRDKKYFSDLFKKYTGLLPKEWSRKEKQKE